MKGWIAISLGDVTGIGPEVTLKALAAEAVSDKFRYLLIGDAPSTLRLNSAMGINLPLEPYGGGGGTGRYFIHSPLDEPLAADLPPGSPFASNAALVSLTDGAKRCLRQEMDALVTAPLSKESVLRAGHRFVGQTEFLTELAGGGATSMMLLGQDDRGRWLRVVLVTTHLPLRRVAEQIQAESVGTAIAMAAQAGRDLELPRCRIGVCGLNPHAGEGGKMGDEEITIIKPAVEAAQKRGLNVVGPLSADTLFHYAYRGDYEVVVAMYHDQGLGPLKMVAFESGVNWTLGLPFIRTSPDHGTAYNIAGKGQADPSSMRAALRLARQLAARRDRISG